MSLGRCRGPGFGTKPCTAPATCRFGRREGPRSCAFKTLHIEYREKGDLKPDDVLRYLLERRVFRAGLEFTCPNCQLPSWIHLDDVKTNSICAYCDHHYDVTPQLRDRDWRYRRSGIFGRDDHQLIPSP
jgi:hypothetical protein